MIHPTLGRSACRAHLPVSCSLALIQEHGQLVAFMLGVCYSSTATPGTLEK